MNGFYGRAITYFNKIIYLLARTNKCKASIFLDPFKAIKRVIKVARAINASYR